MAINVNRVTLVGRVGRDPEKKGSGDGFAVFSVATSRSWKDRDGNKQEKTEWHNVAVFAPPSAKFCLNYVKKGDLIMIEGRLETSSYEKDGETRYSTQVVVAPFDGGVQSMSKDRAGGGSRSDERDSGRDRGGDSYGGGGYGGMDDEIPFEMCWR